MADDYVLVFEAGYLSNWTLLKAVGMCALGLFVTGIGVSRWKQTDWFQRALLIVFCTGWMSGSLLFVWSTVSSAHKFRAALDEGRCEVAAGPVHVVSSSGKPDCIRIAGKELQVANFAEGVHYRQTIPYGGVLQECVRARVHHLGRVILKVELARED